MQFLTPRRRGMLAKTATRAWAISLLVGAFATGSLTAVAQVCPFDDGNSTLANEGLVMTRYALGMRGSAMVANTAFAAADAPAVEANIACPSCGLNITDARDVSNNPTFTATDATIISRKIAGFNGAQLTNGLALGNGSRNTAAAVQSFLLAGCGVGALPTCLLGQVATFGPSGALQCGSLASTRTVVRNILAFDQGLDSKIVAPADGRPVIAFLALTNATTLNLKVMKCGNASCSSGNVSTFADPGITSVAFNGIGMAVPPDGLPVISYHNSTTGQLRIVKCGDVACSAGNIATTLGQTNSVGRFSSIAVGSDTLPVVSYFDATSGRLRVAKCSNAFCTAASSITEVDASINVGVNTSIAVPADGLPVVSYSAYSGSTSTGAGLKVLKCVNAGCTGTSTITTVDNTSLSGLYTSLALGADGLPVVAYQAFGGAGFTSKVVKCGNSACSSGNTLTLVDVQTGSGGRDNSITVPADGRPLLISSGNSIRVVRCGNVACSSGNQASYAVSDAETGILTSLAVAPDGLPIYSYYSVGTTPAALGIVKCSNAGCLSP